MRNIETILASYIECALWISVDNADDSGGKPLDKNYGREDIAAESVEKMREDVTNFVAATNKLLTDDWTDEQIGYDFWLTRNHHGAGFWDRGLPNGRMLTSFAHTYGSADLYVGDDGKIWLA